MQLTRCIDLVFPRSGQTLAVQVPAELFEQIERVNGLLLSFLKQNCAVVPNEHLIRLHP